MEVVLPCLIGSLCFCALWMGTGAVLERGAGSLQGDAIGDRMALVETLRSTLRWPIEAFSFLSQVAHPVPWAS